ncbi:MAG: histidine kinase dimerization/phospho-acceptor domain-containing protein [Gammaproteobacteria bacterium]
MTNIDTSMNSDFSSISDNRADNRAPTRSSCLPKIMEAHYNNSRLNSKGIQQIILEHITTAILLIDETFMIRYVNPAAENLFACSRSRLLSESCLPLFNASAQFIAQLQTALTEQHPFTHRDLVINIPGKSAPTLDCAVNPMVWRDGSATLLIELSEKDRLSRISRDQALISTHNATRLLLKGVAHEVKNPLGGILGAAQLMKRELPSPELEEYVNIIIEETDRLRNLVDRMLGPHNLPVYSPCNIHEILEHVLHIIRAEEFAKSMSIRPPKGFGEREKIGPGDFQNSSEITQPTISIKTRILRQFTLSGRRHRLALCVHITDNGPGIPESLMDSIFLPMVSSRADGNGLGLSIAQDILNQHAGLIECNSEPGETTFTLILPLGLDD